MGCPLSLGQRPKTATSHETMDQSDNQPQQQPSPAATATTTTINYKAKLERKMCFSKETPEPIFDLCSCNLKQVPNGVYINCKILLKTHLLLQDNRLSSLEGGGQLRDLYAITVLNLARNKLKKLPDEIHVLSNLRDFDVSAPGDPEPIQIDFLILAFLRFLFCRCR